MQLFCCSRLLWLNRLICRSFKITTVSNEESLKSPYPLAHIFQIADIFSNLLILKQQVDVHYMDTHVTVNRTVMTIISNNIITFSTQLRYGIFGWLGGHGKRSEIPIAPSQQSTIEKTFDTANTDSFVSILIISISHQM